MKPTVSGLAWASAGRPEPGPGRLVSRTVEVRADASWQAAPGGTAPLGLLPPPPHRRRAAWQRDHHARVDDGVSVDAQHRDVLVRIVADVEPPSIGAEH